MQISFHIGAHRTGSTSFQDCLDRNKHHLHAEGINVWTPKLLRKGLFDGLGGRQMIYPRAASKLRGRVSLRLQQSQANTLVISEENAMGSVRACVRARALYPDVGERLARYVTVLEGRISRIVLCVRGLDLWWGSALAYSVARGQPVPDRAALETIAASPRTWRQVVADVVSASDGAEVIVVPFERVAGRPAVLLRACTSRHTALDCGDVWRNRAPCADALHKELNWRGKPATLAQEDGRWRPFAALESALLREAYADDIAWLSAGADGLATLAEYGSRAKDGKTPQARELTEGQDDDRQEGHVAHSG